MIPSIFLLSRTVWKDILKICSILLAGIISIQKARTKHQQPPKENFKIKIYSNFLNASNNKKESKKASEELEKQNEKKNGLTCWLCKETHQLMDCHQFKIKPAKDRISSEKQISLVHLMKSQAVTHYPISIYPIFYHLFSLKNSYT